MFVHALLSYTDVITLNDYQEVYERLIGVSAKWRDLGLALGVDFNTLCAIDIKYRGDVQDCLREMIDKRLQSGGPLSWGDLCDCLRSPSVKRCACDVAAEIEQEMGKLIILADYVIMVMDI